MNATMTTPPDSRLHKVVELRPSEKFAQSESLRMFVSYRGGHEDEVIRLAWQVEEFGLHTFIAKRDLRIGDDWYSEIKQSIANCDAFLAICHPDFGDGALATDEVNQARELRKLVLPIWTGEQPSGPVGKYHALQLSESIMPVLEIAERCATNPRMTESLVCAIERCARDGSFYLANQLARLFENVQYMTVEQADRLIKVYNQRSLPNLFGNTNQIRSAIAFAPSNSLPSESILTRKINELTTRSVGHASNGDICSAPPTIPVLTRTAPVRPAFTHEVDEIRDEPPWYNSELARRWN